MPRRVKPERREGTVLRGLASVALMAPLVKTDGTVVAWGANDQGQAAFLPPGLDHVVAVAGGWNFSLALKDDGTVVTWGSDATGATDVPNGLGHVVAISPYNAGLALRSDGP